MPEIEVYITGKELKKALTISQDVADIEGVTLDKTLENSEVKVKGTVNYHYIPEIARKMINILEKERKAK